MTATPIPDDRAARWSPQDPSQPSLGHHRPGPAARASSELTIEEFYAAYELAVSTGSDPQLDALLLRHLLFRAARPEELVALTCSDVDVAQATITIRRSKLLRG